MICTKIMRMSTSFHIDIDNYRFGSTEVTHMLFKVAFTCFIAAQVDEEVALGSSLIAKAQNLSAKRFPPWLQAINESGS